VLVSSRFCGPPDSGNGGYVSGLVAEHVEGQAEVTLRLPPPLNRPLSVDRDGTAVVVRDGDRVVAEAGPGVVDVDVPPPVGFDEAVEASAFYPFADGGHPFPTCFVCGPGRPGRDGLGLFAGPVPGRGVAAAPWVPDAALAGPDGVLPVELAWAALDCPSWFGAYCFDRTLGTAVLGRMAADVHTPPRAGGPYVVGGWLRERDGRKVHTASALWDDTGNTVAVARATWITVS
jgi:hypothetical protein